MIQLTDNALKVLQSRYLLKRADGSFSESPDGLFKRVAKAVAQAELTWGNQQDAEHWEDIFYHTLGNFYFLPNSPTLMNAGTHLNQLSACFVLPIEDSLASIFTTLKWAAIIQQSGGGTGFNFSELRPAFDFIKTTGGLSSGPVSFMKVFDAATQYVKQGGKRRGANMGVLSIDHPDIEEFVVCKQEPAILSNFNLSIAISDAFMKAVENDLTWNLVHPHSKRKVKSIPARQLWNLIIESAWKSGDPGLIFIDTINATNPTPSLGQITCTNPCGEVPLLPYESCNLGSINLSNFIKSDNGSSDIDWALLEQMVQVAIRFLDNVVEVNNYLLPETKSITLGNRKIGLGVMGWADTLGKMFIPYDSHSAVALGQKVMHFISEASKKASIELAEQRGVFDNWARSVYYPHTPIRNATRTSIAPTGSISIIADCSPSIEPWFALSYERKHVLNDESLFDVNKVLTEYLKTHHHNYSNILEEVKMTGILKNVTMLPENIKVVFKTALEIDPEWHIQHQAVFQQHTDNAVSKTINLPENSSYDEIESALITSWKQRLKGITVFRNNSKPSVMHLGTTFKKNSCQVCAL
jgi:ribonucleoside-diphosphate reductase alpha chain